MGRRDPRQDRGRNPFARAFAPTQLAGCVLWLRADLGVTIATGVSAWADQSGNGNSATQGTGSAQPTKTASDAGYGGQSTLSFASASSQFLTLTTNPLPSAPISLYFVGQSTSGAVQQQFCGDGGNSTTVYFNNTDWAAFNDGTAATSTNTTQGSALAFAAVASGTSLSLYINSSAATAATAAITAAVGFATTCYLGAQGGSSSFLNGKMAEVAFYNVAHTAAQVSRNFSYFGSRYGKSWS